MVTPGSYGYTQKIISIFVSKTVKTNLIHYEVVTIDICVILPRCCVDMDFEIKSVMYEAVFHTDV